MAGSSGTALCELGRRASASPFPLPAVGHVFAGFQFLGVILVTAIPFGIYDLVEAMDNVESAAAGGDYFPTTRVLTADGVVSLIGCLMGNPFINAVYIGHPGWKAMGGRIGYSAATGIMVIVLSWFGIIAVMTALIPLVAILPILLYIGMLIGSQAFQETPKSHAPAIILALVPQIAAWGKIQIDSALGAAGTNAAAVGIDKLAQVGVLYHGLAGPRRRRDPRRRGARRHHRLHHRSGSSSRPPPSPRRRGADLLRLHARRGHRHRQLAFSGGELSRGRGGAAPLLALRRRCAEADADPSRRQRDAGRMT